MKKGIGDSAAIEFAVAFYDAIGAGENYEFAYKLGCNAIQWAGLPEHLTPILRIKGQNQESSGHNQSNIYYYSARLRMENTKTGLSPHAEWYFGCKFARIHTIFSPKLVRIHLIRIQFCLLEFCRIWLSPQGLDWRN